MVRKAFTPGCRISHASSDTSPHARPAMTVSRSPCTATGLPARALSYRQAALSGSTPTKRRRVAPSCSHKCPHTPPPTPPPHDKTRAVCTELLPEVRADRRRQATHATLQERMRRNLPCRKLLEYLVGH